ncbi:MAG TPA: hypothetical protein VN451_03590 [Chitinophagaceae bacterium]|nr:hypothetical protein [Chitinophagaceae bacterium]
MKKSIKYNVQFILCLLFSAQAFCQTETFDIATFTPPKDFKKDSKPGVVNYTNVNMTTGGFCVIAIYASTASTGDAEKDFERAWTDLVVTPFKAEANPKTETQTNAEGWEVVTAAAPIKLDGNDIYVILTVASGFGKTMSIRTSLNDESYTVQVDALFGNMKLDKTKDVTVINNKKAPVQTNGTSGKFGLMIYKTPPGWSEKTYQNAVEFRPIDIPADEILAMQILQPLNFSGSLEQALAKSYDEVVVMNSATKKNYAGGEEYQKTEAKKSFNGWEYIQGNGGIQVENGTEYKSEYGLVLFVIKVNNRFERVAILKSSKNCNYLSRYFSADRQVYQYAIDRFLFSLQFTDGEEPSLQPGSAKGNGIVGVWQGISLQTTATSGIRYNVFSPIFLTNGQAYFGPKFPTEGLDELDTRIPPELHSRDWGTYTFSNGRGVLKMPYANIPLRMENDKLIITANQTDHTFFQMPSVDGARFNGTYVMSEAYEKIPVITFTADGRFTDNGAIKVLYHEYTDCVNPGLLPGSGTYEVKNYSILFNYTDGRKIKIAFMGTGYDKSNPSPSKLLMSYDENLLTRQ